MDKLTVSMENYLEAIYELSENGGTRVTDIAQKLNVSKASVNSAIAFLGERGLIKSERYKEVYLTEAGLLEAKLVSIKHVIIREFFISVLKVDPDIADRDACAIEHVISAESILKMKEFLKGRTWTVKSIK